ncbi:MAG: hypothetical protein AAF317_03785, partial [Pseudomonadota bacterium]
NVATGTLTKIPVLRSERGKKSRRVIFLPKAAHHASRFAQSRVGFAGERQKYLQVRLDLPQTCAFQTWLRIR